MSRHEELARFTASGKTFFFNKGRARNDTDYLAVNTIYGKGSQERITLFPSQMLEFYRHYLDALELLTGLRPGNSAVSESSSSLPDIPSDCPKCDKAKGVYELAVYGPEDWQISCMECNHTVFDTESD